MSKTRLSLRSLTTACAGSLLLLNAGPAAASLDNGLIAYWPMDGDLLDATATGAHGTFWSIALASNPARLS